MSLFAKRSDYLPKAVIEASCNCAGVFLLRKDSLGDVPSVLLVESKRKSYQYSFPKGKRNKNEDTLTTAKRELYEETGIREEDIEILPNRWYLEYLPKTGKPHIIYYLCYLKNTDVVLNPIDTKEIVSANWFKPDEIYRMRRSFYQSRRQIVQKAIREFVVRERYPMMELEEPIKKTQFFQQSPTAFSYYT